MTGGEGSKVRPLIPLPWVNSMSAGTAHVRLLTPAAPRPNPVLEFSKGFPLKGLCHEMKIFFEVPSSKISKNFMYTVCADGL
jgi:hypothetical protein